MHTNSGVPNHTFALIVDGGTYNGQTVMGIGLTKAAHIYWRAQAFYQGPASDFADHADSILAACNDLRGIDLPDLTTGLPSGQILTAGNCHQVDFASLATELSTPPTQCNFQPLLNPNAPALCSAGQVVSDIFMEDFEAGLGSWTLTNQGVFSGWQPHDWEADNTLPGGRAGAGRSTCRRGRHPDHRGRGAGLLVRTRTAGRRPAGGGERRAGRARPGGAPRRPPTKAAARASIGGGDRPGRGRVSWKAKACRSKVRVPSPVSPPSGPPHGPKRVPLRPPRGPTTATVSP